MTGALEDASDTVTRVDCVTGAFRAGIAAVTQDRKGNGSIFRHIRTRHLLHQMLLRRLRLETLPLRPTYFVAIA